ncbi:sensor histidine kinase [Chelativorans salis]|uniref:histidine kinase n=1 Tax=Chelativorans salis TaxID=2978478 RepID=A0ABT2LSS8_9HYPH|nr:HAMP domain-containing sensor histidine kinase [Chelativorans sp. EGI FJ00035]MCT7377401.1 HAMP domain-containing histidine kinase [Chelativorans sp. EGI FJ00035]
MESLKDALPDIQEKWRPSLAMVIGAVLTIVLTLPLAGMAAVVALSRSPETLLDSLSNNTGRILAAGFVVVAVTAVVGFLFWRLVTRPVQDLVRWTEAVTLGSTAPAVREAHYGTQELARLAAGFSKMVARLRERSDYISTFTAHVSHELKSPLTSIAGAAELMRDAGDEMGPEARARFLENIETDAVRLSALVARMRDLARAENVRLGESSHLPDILARLQERFPSLSIFAAGAAPLLPMPFEDALVVFSHLADNAIAHGAGELTIRVATRHGRAVIEIANDGDPISVGNRGRIFEPFYTTRRESGGTGMGLVIVQAMLKAHGCDIALSDAETGAGFRITLPA